MLNWANRFSIFCFMDNNDYHFEKASFECILAVGSKRSVQLTSGNAFQQLRSFYDQKPGWLFGHLGYDLKNETEAVTSSTTDHVGFGIGFFFEPEIVLRFADGKLRVICGEQEAEEILQSIEAEPAVTKQTSSLHIPIKSALDKPSYIRIVEALRNHILRGDCYEINFCQQFFAEDITIDPLAVYQQLIKVSPTPFAALYKLNDKYCLCASPERYLKKQGDLLTSQPMKGTIKRNPDKTVDEINKAALQHSSKDQSENVMVVDLVRNDLSRIAEEGSVNVKELFGVYSFPNVHQMISTVEGTIKKELHWTDAIKATFPMGSMTGAPKKRVLELIDQYEPVHRGLFSGSIGYVTPESDFDFNVVIRSIFYNESKKYLSFFAGGGITFYSNSEDEYEESLLKTMAIKSVLK